MITPIWTHGECLRFATVKPGSITIWEVAFTLIHAPAEVKILTAPDEIADGKNFLFLPALSRLAFTLRNAIFVWDAAVSRFLLKLESVPNPRSTGIRNPHFFGSSFSSDGHFLACSAITGEVYVWKESTTGYTLHQNLAFSARPPGQDEGPLLSPGGESGILSISPTISLWPTKDQIFSLPSDLARVNDMFNYVLEFSTDGTLAAFGRRRGNSVTILDLQSGEPWLFIDTGVKIECLGMNESVIVVVGEEQVVTWKLPTGNRTLDTRSSVNDSADVATIDHSPPSRNLQENILMSISLDLSRIAIAGYPTESHSPGLEVYDTSTGRCLASTTTTDWLEPRFTPDGQEVWSVSGPYHMEGWKITENTESSTTELGPLEPTSCKPDVFPWRSPRNYEVTQDGWVLGPSQKRLLWLPHNWRSHEVCRAWGGRFLGLLYAELPELVILEFFE